MKKNTHKPILTNWAMDTGSSQKKIYYDGF